MGCLNVSGVFFSIQKWAFQANAYEVTGAKINPQYLSDIIDTTIIAMPIRVPKT